MNFEDLPIYLSREQVAEVLQISIRKVNDVIEKWSIPVQRFDGSVRISKVDLIKWVRQMSRPLNYRQAGLYLGLSPESIHLLGEKSLIKFESNAQGVNFFQPSLDQFRNNLEDQSVIYCSTLDRAEELVKAIKCRLELSVQVYFCELCKEDRNIALSFCNYCEKAACYPHASSTLKTPSRKEPGFERNVICSLCLQKYNPPLILPRGGHIRGSAE